MAALAFLAFTLKRLWALDLELRAHRERQWVHLREEQRRAREAADAERSDRLQQKREKDRIDGG